MERKQHFSTKLRNEEVKRIYRKLRADLGELAPFVTKEYYYRELNRLTGLSVRTLFHILNHL